MTVSASHTSFLEHSRGLSAQPARTHDTDTERSQGCSHEGRAVEEGQAIKEDYGPNDSGRDEQIGVPAQPQVVQGHLLPKVVPYR